VPAHAASVAQVTVSNFQFTDQATGTPVTHVALGDTVHWTWTSGTHTVTAGVNGLTDAATGRAFDAGVHSAGSSDAGFSFTPTAAGTYAYYCQIHADMRGLIVVS
jgi:plastocyanin